MSGILPVDPAGRVLAGAGGEPMAAPARLLGSGPRTTVRLDADTTAVRVDAHELDELAAALGGRTAEPREFSGNRAVAKAVALLRHRDRVRFDPADGEQLIFDDDGIVARGRGTRRLFPRIDPAVIGLVGLAGTEQILLGRNRGRDFFSLIAGYVDSGENLEEAFAREVMEETGRRIRDITYWGSQPWPVSGSLMVAFTAVTDDVDAVAETDGELADVRWVDRAGLADLPIARPGSIANTLINEWRDRQ